MRDAVSSRRFMKVNAQGSATCPMERNNIIETPFKGMNILGNKVGLYSTQPKNGEKNEQNFK